MEEDSPARKEKQVRIEAAQIGRFFLALLTYPTYYPSMSQNTKSPNSFNKLSIIESNKVIAAFDANPLPANDGLTGYAKNIAISEAESVPTEAVRDTNAAIIKALQQQGFDVWVRHARIFRLESKEEIYDRILQFAAESGSNIVRVDDLEPKEVIDCNGGSTRVILINPETKTVIFDSQTQCSLEDRFNRGFGTLVCLKFIEDFLFRTRRLTVRVETRTDVRVTIQSLRGKQ